MKRNRTVVYMEHFMIDIQESDGSISVTGWVNKPDKDVYKLVDNIVFMEKNSDKEAHSIRPTILSDSP